MSSARQTGTGRWFHRRWCVKVPLRPAPELEQALEIIQQADALLQQDGVSLIGVPPVAVAGGV
jgi:hypothetical protein